MKEKDLIEIIITEDRDVAMAAVKEFSRKRYNDGQKSLAKLVRDMRFKQRHGSVSSEVKEIEKRVDRTVEDILK